MRSKRWLVLMIAAACADSPSAPPSEDAAPAEEAAPTPDDPELAAAYAEAASAETFDNTPVVPLDTSFAAEDEARLVVGKDTRKRMEDTSIEPYSSAVMLWTGFRDARGKEWKASCSGTIIAPDAVLTAAHCLYDPEHGGMAETALVIPGAYLDARGVQQSLRGVGTALTTSDDFSLPPEFSRDGIYSQEDFRYDYAVIHMTRPLGRSAGFRSVAVAPNPSGAFARMVAYHEDLCGEGRDCKKTRERPQFVSSDKVREVRADGWFTHAIDSAKGSSGGGISSGSAAASPIFAINIAQSQREGLNYGLLITPSILADIRAWAGI